MSDPSTRSVAESDPGPGRERVRRHGSGVLLIRGGAGTGKSTALRERVLQVGEKGLDPSRVALIASTGRSAAAHRLRLEEDLPGPYESLSVFTWEGLAEEILRHRPVEAGLGPTFEVVGAAERLAMLLARVDELPLRNHEIRGNPAGLLRELLVGIDRAKRQGEDGGELAELIELHDSLLAAADLLDRNDLPRIVARLLEDKALAEEVTARYPHLVIDELEDLHPARAGLLHRLAPAGLESVVASFDPSRAIYGPGAEQRFLEAFPEPDEFVLDEAWRMSDLRIKAARAALGSGPLPEGDWEAKGDEGSVRYWRPASPRAEAQAAAREVELQIASGIAPEELAIAVPDVNSQGGGVVGALAERGIPARPGGGAALFRQPEVRDTIAWLRALTDPTDARAVTRALMRPPTELRSLDLAKLTQISKRRKLDMISACEASLESPQMAPEARQRIEAFLTLYRAAAGAVDTRRPDAYVRRLIERIGFRRQRLFAARPETAERLLGLSRLAEIATDFSRRDPNASVREFTGFLIALTEGGLEPAGGPVLPGVGAVPVLNLDMLKGGEWTRIWVLGLERPFGTIRTPGPGIGDDPTHPGGPESARIAVATALTSAREEVVLSRAGDAEPDPVAAILEATGGLEEVHEEELFGPDEDVAATYRTMLGEVIEASWKTGSELNEPRLDTAFDVNRAVARYLELLKLAALAQRDDGASDEEAIEAVNGLLAQIATPEQLAELDASTLDPYLLATERERGMRQGLADSRVEPSLDAFLPRRGDDLRLSATDLDMYLTCPLKYKFARVFGIPTPPTVNMRFGILIHNVLQRFHEAELAGKDHSEDGLATLMALLDEGWRRGGFGNSNDELQFLDRAREAMRAYWRNEKSSKSKPAFLERQFEFRIGSHFLRGRVDRVDQDPEGNFEVIDYKTGQRVDSSRHGGDIQLALYRLGAREAWGIEPAAGSYYYVLEGEKVEVESSPDDRERVERTVLEVGEGVLGQDFEPRPSPAVCGWCDFKLVCPAAEA
ncbi:MAG TPA: ATP-dependent DNA helicase [Solirubrobacterales bacterium]|nr:ATP-dependent DNA helicase [Solirubrobacterales bacterium]